MKKILKTVFGFLITLCLVCTFFFATEWALGAIGSDPEYDLLFKNILHDDTLSESNSGMVSESARVEQPLCGSNYIDFKNCTVDRATFADKLTGDGPGGSVSFHLADCRWTDVKKMYHQSDCHKYGNSFVAAGLDLVDRINFGHHRLYCCRVVAN